MNAFVFNFFMFLLPTVFGYKFPHSFKKCHLNDPALNSCLDAAIENAFKMIGGSGLSSLNLPSIDPVRVTRVEIGAGTNAVKLVQKYSDVKVYGFSTLNVKNSHYDSDKKVITFTSMHPEIRQEAHYDINGRIMIFPVFGNGESEILLRDVTAQHVISFEEKNKNGKKYFTALSYKVKIDIKGAHYDFKNLFNGDEKLANNILTVINENWNEIWEDVRSGVENSYGEVFKLIINGFFENIPVVDIFLK